jgi:hypothetical protein
MKALVIIILLITTYSSAFSQARIRGRAKSGKFEGAKSVMITGGLSGDFLSANFAYSENISNKTTLNYTLGGRFGEINGASYLGLNLELLVSRYLWQSKRFLFVDFVYGIGGIRDDVTIGERNVVDYSFGGGLGLMSELYLLNNMVLVGSVRQHYYYRGLVGSFRTTAQLGVRIFFGQ